MAESERREYTRFPLQAVTKYSFINTETGDRVGEKLAGETENIGAGGVLLRGRLPAIEEVSAILNQRLAVACELQFSDEAEPINFIGRVAWIEDIDPQRDTCTLGVMIREISHRDRDRLNRFVIGRAIL